MGGIPKGNVYSVYVHTTPDGRAYVGVSGTDLEYRWKNGKNYQNCTRFRKAIEEYGWENIRHEVIASGMSREEAWNLEEQVIAELNATDEEHGYNESPGHNALGKNSKRKVVAKLKQRTSELAVKSRPVLQIEPITMQVVKRWNCAKDAADAYHFKSACTVSNACRRRSTDNIVTPCSHGFFWSYEDEYDETYFEQFKGIALLKSGRLPRTGPRAPKSQFTEMSEESKRKIGDKNSKPVVCIETGQVFRSTRDAAKQFGVSAAAIGNCVHGKSKTCAGHTWVFA